NVDSSGLGTFFGTVNIVSPVGNIIQTGVLRGTAGINDCEPTPGSVCVASCNRPGHLVGIYEAVDNSAPNSNVLITIANFKANLNLLIASPIPIYQARLDGLFAPPPAITQRVTLTPEKLSYAKDETIKVRVTNASEKIIRGDDLKSRCTILE